MKILTHLTCLICLLALISCESELTTNNASLEKKLILNPTRAEWQQYDICTLRARITNVPLMDVHYFWDLDEGKGFQENSYMTNAIFYQNKMHNVRIRALDAFTGDLLGYDSLQVNIRPPVAFVDLTATVTDTTLPMSSIGQFDVPIYFTLKTSTPQNLIKKVWSFDDGSEDIVDSSQNLTIGRYFLRAGRMTVRVKVYEKSGAYLGSDSVTVNLHMPTFDVEQLKNFSSVTVMLDVGTQHPVSTDPLFVNPFVVTLGNIGVGGTTEFSAEGSMFRGRYYYKYLSNPNELYFLIQDTVSMEFSDDHTMLKSVRVSVQDTGRLIPSGSNDGALHYTYTLKDLDLLTVTPTEIVYRSTPEFVNDFLEDLEFKAVNQPNHASGIHSGSGGAPSPIQRKVGAPFALVVFTK